MRGILFLVVAALFLCVLATLLLRYFFRLRRSSEATWEELLGRLEKIDREGIAAIAQDALSTSRDDAFSMEPEAIWALLGGMEGLELLQRNCAVLVELATYVQRWHPEALVVAEQLRLSAREIEWHVGRLKGAERTGNLQTAFAGYAQRAVATYYGMTQHVLELYEQVQFPELAELRQAI